MKYAVIYQSKSGNTQRVAEQIYGAISTAEKEMVDIDIDQEIPDADVYLIGFGIHGYSCSMDITDVLEQIAGKKYALFVTCGYTPTDQYKEKLAKNLEVWLPDAGEYLGMYLCQGNVESDRRKIMISQMPSKERELRQMFEMGSIHPDEEDLENAVDFAIKIQAESVR
ncbi:MAG: flavodoxin family protein [Fusicatenibacter sp.]|nr:flavodoxin family protein [Fusicatenibacter sp.]